MMAQLINRWKVIKKQHSLAAQSAVFSGMLAASLGMYLAAQANSPAWMGIFLLIFAAMNCTAIAL